MFGYRWLFEPDQQQMSAWLMYDAMPGVGAAAQGAMAAQFRDRQVEPGAQIVLSPWHVQRHERLWDDPDEFDPARWQTEAGRQSSRAAYLPFSAGPRVCTGAGFAMIEGPLILASLLRRFRFAPSGPPPVPVAYLTVRARDGIRLAVSTHP